MLQKLCFIFSPLDMQAVRIFSGFKLPCYRYFCVQYFLLQGTAIIHTVHTLFVVMINLHFEDSYTPCSRLFFNIAKCLHGFLTLLFKVREVINLQFYYAMYMLCSSPCLILSFGKLCSLCFLSPCFRLFNRLDFLSFFSVYSYLLTFLFQLLSRFF
jgi:hypothetical protein